MIVRELYDAICKVARENPELNKFTVNKKLVVIRVIEGDEENEKEREAKEKTNLCEGIIEVEGKEYQLFLM